VRTLHRAGRVVRRCVAADDTLVRPTPSSRYAALRLAVSALALCWATASLPARAAGVAGLGPQDGPRATRLVAGTRPPVALGDGMVLRGVAVEPLRVVATLEGPSSGTLTLTGKCGDVSNLPGTASFDLTWRGGQPAPTAVLRLAEGIALRDDGRFWGTIDPCPPPLAVAAPAAEAGPARPSPWPALAWVAMVVLAWRVASYLLERRITPAPAPRAAAHLVIVRAATLAAAAAALLYGPTTGDLGRLLPAFSRGLAFTALPLIAALWAGAALRRLAGPLRGPRWPLAALLALAPLAYASWRLAAPLDVGPADLVAASLLAAFGLWHGTRSADGRSLRNHMRLLALSLVLALTLGELTVRALLPATQPMPPADEARLTIDILDEDQLCNALYPAEFPLATAGLTFEDRTAVARQRPLHVLHVGDSVTQGVGVEPAFWFTTLLSNAQPDVAHINAGYSGSGTDFHYLLIQSWLDRMHFDLVVLHLFSNDLNDMSAHYLCCPDGPLLDYRGAEPVARCPTAVARPHRLAILRHSPAPYALRVATAFSRLAAHLTLILGGTPTDADNRTDGDQTRVLKRIAEATRAHGTRFVVVRLPAEYEADVSGPVPTIAASAQAAPLETLGVPLLDPAPALFAASPQGEVSGWYIGDQTHFNAAGHAYLADWLAPRLRALLDAAAPTTTARRDGP
jgi:lysophospholipase L1-like esterase